eukprot:NODE_73_length_24441_cov_0.672952.p14 type:complete len:167 gc:universal NODE_73_length_24441_cov_0.672952:16765-16265(-)
MIKSPCVIITNMSSAVKRLMNEYKQLCKDAPDGITAGPSEESNYLEWDAIIMGPDGCPYEGGVFTAKLTFPPNYPLQPPKMRFTCEMLHPNVYQNGEVCISILHAPGEDQYGYEDSSERWSPVQSVEKILLSVVSMLHEPNPESAANIDASKLLRESPKEYERQVF